MNSDDDEDDDADDDDNDYDDNHAIWPLIIYFAGHTVTLYPIAFALPRKSYGRGLLFTRKLERLWRRDFCDGAKLTPCSAPISKVERHISKRFCAINVGAV